MGLGNDEIGVIDVSGVIVDADKLDAQLRKFGDDDSIKAIILHINSPGGGAAASQEIYHEVLRVRQEKHKKVIASVESVGASGAYYIASACDSIYANDASVVGSIGVIMEWTNYGELYRWAKLKSVVIHAGELKDAGDPTHDVTPQEQVYFQSLVDNMYGQFIHDVATGRHTSGRKDQAAGDRTSMDRPAVVAARADRQGWRFPDSTDGYGEERGDHRRTDDRSAGQSEKRPHRHAHLRRRRPVSEPKPASKPFAGVLLHVEVIFALGWRRD